MGIAINDKLEPFDKIKRRMPQEEMGLLIGNGASMSMWEKFGYKSLYEMACDPARGVHLEACDQGLFAKLDTRNFEAVLSSLTLAGQVWGIFGKPPKDIEDLRASYRRIRTSLIHAVKEVHLPNELLTEGIKSRLRGILAEHEYVFTTNYDLMTYWAMMDEKVKFKDFLWSKWGNDPDRVWFDDNNTDLWNEKCTKVLYLHGGLHLYRCAHGTYKKVGGEQGGLLTQFAGDGDSIPLFISEGTSADKRSAIHRNDYLSFAYERFSTHRGSLVVFGHSLNEESDKHITDAINKWRRYDQRRFHGGNFRRVIAISLRPGGDSHKIIADKTRLSKALSQYEVLFFDSTTHPLSDPALRPQIPTQN